MLRPTKKMSKFHLMILLLTSVQTSLCQLQGVPNYTDCYVLIPSLIGDGNCDNFLPYNHADCGYDGGDCEQFNERFPGCNASSTELVTDGKCQNIYPYNTTECGYDGGDCIQFQSEYPECYVLQTDWIGDGQCQDFEPYNTKACDFDGGDCTLGEKKDHSNRDVLLSCGAVLIFVALVGAETWECKRRRQTSPSGPAAIGSEDGSDHGDSKPRAQDAIPIENDETIDVLNLSTERPIGTEGVGGDIEEAIDLNIEMPIETEQPTETEEAGGEIEDFANSHIETTIETEKATRSRDVELIDLGLDLSDDEDTNPEEADEDRIIIIDSEMPVIKTEKASRDDELRDLGLDLSDDEDKNPEEAEENLNYEASIETDKDVSVSDDDLIDLGSDDTEEDLDPEKPVTEIDDEELDSKIPAEEEENEDNDTDTKMAAEEEEANESEEQGDANAETEKDAVDIAKFNEERNARIEEALKYLEASESDDSLSSMLNSSSVSSDSDATANAGNLTPTSKGSFENLQKSNNDDSDSDDDSDNDNNSDSKKKRFTNYGLLTSLIKRHKKRISLSSRSSGRSSSPPPETEEKSNDAATKNATITETVTPDTDTDTDTDPPSKAAPSPVQLDGSADSDNDSSDVEGFSDVDDNMLEDISLSPSLPETEEKIDDANATAASSDNATTPLAPEKS